MSKSSICFWAADAIECKFWVMFGSRFLDNSSTDSERVYSFGKGDSRALLSIVQHVRHFCSLTPRKWGSSGPTVVYALRKRLIFIFSETTNASSF